MAPLNEPALIFVSAEKQKRRSRAQESPLSANGVTWLSLIDQISQTAANLVGNKMPAGPWPFG